MLPHLPCPVVGSERKFLVQGIHSSLFDLEANVPETSAHLSRDTQSSLISRWSLDQEDGSSMWWSWSAVIP